MQQAYIAQITKDGVIRIIFTGSLYQALIFATAAEAMSHLPPTPANLQFRGGETITIGDFRIEELPNGWAIACVGPFDFSETQMLEAIQAT